MKTIFKALMIAAALSLATPAAVFAKNDKSHGRGNSHDASAHSRGGERHHDRHSDENILRNYVLSHYRQHCPPGLAKKNPPCVPPGQAKKYRIGSRLPEGGYVRLPSDIVSQLTPAPDYARYVRMDRNVYLISEGTRKVLDAFELFSAVK